MLLSIPGGCLTQKLYAALAISQAQAAATAAASQSESEAAAALAAAQEAEASHTSAQQAAAEQLQRLQHELLEHQERRQQLHARVEAAEAQLQGAAAAMERADATVVQLQGRLAESAQQLVDREVALAAACAAQEAAAQQVEALTLERSAKAGWLSDRCDVYLSHGLLRCATRRWPALFHAALACASPALHDNALHRAPPTQSVPSHSPPTRRCKQLTLRVHRLSAARRCRVRIRAEACRSSTTAARLGAQLRRQRAMLRRGRVLVVELRQQGETSAARVAELEVGGLLLLRNAMSGLMHALPALKAWLHSCCTANAHGACSNVECLSPPQQHQAQHPLPTPTPLPLFTTPSRHPRCSL